MNHNKNQTIILYKRKMLGVVKYIIACQNQIPIIQTLVYSISHNIMDSVDILLCVVICYLIYLFEQICLVWPVRPDPPGWSHS